MPQFNFSLDDFPSACFTEFPSKWNPLGISDLAPSEQGPLYELLDCLDKPRNRDEVDQDDVLLVRAQAGGLLDQLFGPSVFSDGNDLVLKLGANEFIVHQSSQGFTCGKLLGEISVADKPVLITTSESTVEYWPTNLLFFPDETASIADYCFRIRLALNPEIGLSPLQLRQIIRKNESIAAYLKPLPQSSGSGGETLKLAELELGEYLAVNATSVDTKYGPSWVIELQDGRKFWTSGLVKRALSSGFKVSADKPATLVIVGHRTDSAGRKIVDCALFDRQPRQQTQSTTAPGGRLGVMKTPSKPFAKKADQALPISPSELASSLF